MPVATLWAPGAPVGVASQRLALGVSRAFAGDSGRRNTLLQRSLRGSRIAGGCGSSTARQPRSSGKPPLIASRRNPKAASGCERLLGTSPAVASSADDYARPWSAAEDGSLGPCTRPRTIISGIATTGHGPMPVTAGKLPSDDGGRVANSAAGPGTLLRHGDGLHSSPSLRAATRQLTAPRLSSHHSAPRRFLRARVSSAVRSRTTTSSRIRCSGPSGSLPQRPRSFVAAGRLRLRHYLDRDTCN